MHPLQAVVERVAGLRRRWQAAICFLAGLITALGQAPVGAWPATVLGLAVLFALLQAAPGWRRAALLGWAAGTGYFILSLSWIVEPFLVDVARHGWMAPFALILLSAGLALFWGGACALTRAAGGRVGAWIGAFVLAEALRGMLFTGFPWAQVGHVWIGTPMLHWASVAGALGLCAIALALAAGLGLAATGRKTVIGAGLIAATAALYLTGSVLMPQTETPPDAPVVRLVQPNAAQHEKWNPDRMQVFFDRQMGFTRAPGEFGRPDLIVWPETAIPVPLHRAAGTLRTIARAARGAKVVLGVQRVDGLRFFNSLVVLDERGKVLSLYDKYHLVPFGEYMPFGDTLARFGIHGLAARDGNGYSAGPGPQIIGLGELGRALPLICYEGVFARDVAAAPGRADFLLLITNDAWFGKVSGPYQHLAQARLRSAEQGLPMIRAANTGISALIDPAGRVLAQIPLGQAGWVDAALPAPLPPTIYARIGDRPLAGLALVLLGLSLARNRRSRRRS